MAPEWLSNFLNHPEQVSKRPKPTNFEKTFTLHNQIFRQWNGWRFGRGLDKRGFYGNVIVLVGACVTWWCEKGSIKGINLNLAAFGILPSRCWNMFISRAQFNRNLTPGLVSELTVLLNKREMTQTNVSTIIHSIWKITLNSTDNSINYFTNTFAHCLVTLPKH